MLKFMNSESTNKIENLGKAEEKTIKNTSTLTSKQSNIETLIESSNFRKKRLLDVKCCFKINYY